MSKRSFSRAFKANAIDNDNLSDDSSSSANEDRINRKKIRAICQETTEYDFERPSTSGETHDPYAMRDTGCDSSISVISSNASTLSSYYGEASESSSSREQSGVNPSSSNPEANIPVVEYPEQGGNASSSSISVIEDPMEGKGKKIAKIRRSICHNLRSNDSSSSSYEQIPSLSGNQGNSSKSQGLKRKRCKKSKRDKNPEDILAMRFEKVKISPTQSVRKRLSKLLQKLTEEEQQDEEDSGNGDDVCNVQLTRKRKFSDDSDSPDTTAGTASNAQRPIYG